MAVIPGHPEEKEIEVSKEAWPLVKVAVESVTIALESGASLMASRLYPTDKFVVAAIDQPVLLLFNRVAAPAGGLGERLKLYGDLR
jgi:hypothetical protein